MQWILLRGCECSLPSDTKRLVSLPALHVTSDRSDFFVVISLTRFFGLSLESNWKDFFNRYGYFEQNISKIRFA